MPRTGRASAGRPAGRLGWRPTYPWNGAPPRMSAGRRRSPASRGLRRSSGSEAFLCTATEDGASCRVIALDRRRGRSIWDREALSRQPGHKSDRNSYATPTPCTDGERVYAVFGDGSFAALDFAGRRSVWTNRDFPFYGEHGLGTSPILWKDLLIMARDGSHPPPETVRVGMSRGTRLASSPWIRATGKSAGRPTAGLSRIAHVVPTIWNAPDGHAEVISGAGDVVQGSDPRAASGSGPRRTSGKEWCLRSSLGDGPGLYRLRLGRTRIYQGLSAGRQGRPRGVQPGMGTAQGMPHIPSFLYLQALPLHDQRRRRRHVPEGRYRRDRLAGTRRGSFSASPVGAEGHIYFLSDAGETTVIAAGPQFKVLAKNPLGEKVQASMAVSQGRLYIRTANNLYALGGK